MRVCRLRSFTICVCVCRKQVQTVVSLLFAGMFPLRSINKRLVEIIGACYSVNGNINERAAVYSPYSSKSEELCSSSNQVRESECQTETENGEREIL